jgi:hypothetical protein
MKRSTTRRSTGRLIATAAVATTLAMSLAMSFSGASPAGAAATTTVPKKQAPPNAAPAKNALPVLNVTDVKTGKPFPLASVVNGTLPTLIWFWAPT